MEAQLVQTVMELVKAIWEMPEVKIISYHSLLNFVLAIIAALNTGTFDPGKLWEVFGKKIVPFSTLYFVLQLVGAELGYAAMATLVFAAIELALVKDMADSLSKIPGLEAVFNLLPENIRNTLTKGEVLQLEFLEAEVSETLE